MLIDHPQDFEEEARFIRDRALLDLENPGERMLDATIRSLRAGTRKYAFRDSLVGLGEGLREVMLSWGVPGSAILTNDSPVAGCFVEKKHWDFVVRGPDGREMVLIEFTRWEYYCSSGTSASTIMYPWLGMLYDLCFRPRTAFRGIVTVRRAKQRKWPNVAAFEQRRRRHLHRFYGNCRMHGLIDAFAYLDLTPGSTPEPLDLGLVPFLATLYANLFRESPDSWPAPIFPLDPPPRAGRFGIETPAAAGRLGPVMTHA